MAGTLVAPRTFAAAASASWLVPAASGFVAAAIVFVAAATGGAALAAVAAVTAAPLRQLVATPFFQPWPSASFPASFGILHSLWKQRIASCSFCGGLFSLRPVLPPLLLPAFALPFIPPPFFPGFLFFLGILVVSL